ncbi:MAG: hypothetical protein HZA90_15290 [Verrucomicrobia bacterium]|nr:hypothetical protein [Verrucomicrobiota bacterium]
MARAPQVLVCFALKEEAAPFRRLVADRPNLHVLITGIGRQNSERRFREALAPPLPSLVLTCGYAGALNPARGLGDVVFSADPASGLKPKLAALGAKEARFHCADRMIATATEKAALRQSTGADAVEMESEIIRHLCRERGLSSATVRVISDTANEDLPLDFNLLTTPDLRLSYAKLAVAIMKSPGVVPALLKLQKQTRHAAVKLAEVLMRALSDFAPD